MNNELCKDIRILHCISEGENDNFWTACSSVAAMIIDYSKLQSKLEAWGFTFYKIQIEVHVSILLVWITYKITCTVLNLTNIFSVK